MAGALFLLNRLALRAEVRGPSMMPVLFDGDRVLVNTIVLRLRRPRTGEVVLAVMPGVAGEWVIKRVTAVEQHAASSGAVGTGNRHTRAGRDTAYILIGDNRPWSTDSRDLGPVTRRQILGKVWYRYWPPERRGRVT